MQELEGYIDTARQHERDSRASEDEYDGLSPEEINELVAVRAEA
jgi:hypothetical protein